MKLSVFIVGQARFSCALVQAAASLAKCGCRGTFLFVGLQSRIVSAGQLLLVAERHLPGNRKFRGNLIVVCWNVGVLRFRSWVPTVTKWLGAGARRISIHCSKIEILSSSTSLCLPRFGLIRNCCGGCESMSSANCFYSHVVRRATYMPEIYSRALSTVSGIRRAASLIYEIVK
jgi:hypothetical protein